MKRSPLIKKFNIGGVPDSFVISPNGKIVRRDLRCDAILPFLTNLLKLK